METVTVNKVEYPAIKVGEHTYQVACNAFTPIVYQGAFSAERADGTRRPKDIMEAVGIIANTLTAVEAPAIAPLMEIFYAFAKTANPKLCGFREFVEGFPADAFDMTRKDGWAADVMSLIEANFFPGAKEEGVGAEEAEEPSA